MNIGNRVVSRRFFGREALKGVLAFFAVSSLDSVDGFLLGSPAKAEGLVGDKIYLDKQSNTALYVTPQYEKDIAEKLKKDFGLSIVLGPPIKLVSDRRFQVEFGKSLLMANNVADSDRANYEKKYKFLLKDRVLYLCLQENTLAGPVVKVGMVVKPTDSNNGSFVSSYLQFLKSEGISELDAKNKVLEISQVCFPEIISK